MSGIMSIIIATKNRSGEIKKHALASLERSTFRDFLCVVWDASQDEETRRAVEDGTWTFPLKYFRAPRSGLASQRNDAVKQILMHERSIRYVLFIDDDSELSRDALTGVTAAFGVPNVWGVNIPHVPQLDADGTYHGPEPERPTPRRMTPYLHNRSCCPEQHGIPVDWLSGCGMAFRSETFTQLGLRFPEAFQRFGGYSLGEDSGFSFYLKKKLGKTLVNAPCGALCHHVSGAARLDVAGMTASKWYNFHLLFDAIYDGVSGPQLNVYRLNFSLFSYAAALKVLLRARKPDLAAMLRGIRAARGALAEYRRNGNVQGLFREN